MNNKFFIQQYSADRFFHGGIGYADAEKILMQKNFEPILFPCYNNFSMGAKVNRLFYLLKVFSRVNKGSQVIFLFPVFAKMNQLLLRLLRLKKGIKVICFIADIDGIKDGDKKLLEQEIIEFKRYRYFIVHNEAMRQWLLGHVSPTTIEPIEFFDFLANPFIKNRKKSKQIVFAGNLAKSEFLEKLFLLKSMMPELHFKLYGPGCSDVVSSQENVSYMGIEPPQELPVILEGSFGLVWDCDSIEVPGGSLGNYMGYISHHKLSLYILAGLPLIVPEMAASAPLVKMYQIGITINSLFEIEDRINSLPAEVYQQMQDNMRPLAKKISNGNCLGEAIDRLTRNF
jgi:hypothetical protein